MFQIRKKSRKVLRTRRTTKKVGGTTTYRKKSQYAKSYIPPVISGGAPVAFRRAYYDAIMYFDDSDTLQIRDGTGQPTSWIVAGSSSVDASIAQKQFGLAVDCAFDDLVSPAEMRDLFSQYKFGTTELLLTYELGDSSYAIGSGGTAGAQAAGPPHVYYYYDSTNSLPPATVVEAMQRGNIRQHLLTNTQPLMIRHTLRPQLQAQDGDGQPSSLAVADYNPWMKLTLPNGDAANLAPHFGTHFYIRNFGGSFTGCRIRITAIQNLYLRYPR